MNKSLLGIDSLSAKKLIDMVNSMMSPDDAATILATLTNPSGNLVDTNQATSRAKFLSKLPQLPQEIQDRLTQGVDQLCDSELYSVVALGTSLTSITDLFAPDGSKTVGLRNISNQKIDADKYFLLHAIEILYGVDATASGKIATFGTIAVPAGIFDGEIELSQNGRKIVPKQSMHCFYNGIVTGDTNVFTGRAIFRLDNPKLLYPQQELKGTVEWGYTPGAAANSYLKIRLLGTANERA